MKRYEVVCELVGYNCLIDIIEAADEKHARKIMWEQRMDDSQKDRCVDIEVFELDESNS